MSMKMKGLGKGLSALFADTEAEYVQNTLLGEDKGEKKPDEAAAPATRIVQVEKPVFVSDGKPSELPISKVVPNPDQPRKHFDQTALEELAESIRIHGIIQPLVVVKKGDQYIIIAGERRWRASQIAGLKTVPAVIKQFSEQQIKEVALIENLQREDLNPIEAAEAIRELMDRYSFTQEQVSERIGKSRSNVANALRLLTLNPEVVALVREGKLSAGHARCLVPIADAQRQIELARSAVENQLSVRDLERLATGAKLTAAKKAKAASSAKRPEGTRELKDLVHTMQRVLGTKVTAIGNENKGRITIDYFSSDDIDRIFRLFDKLK